MAGVYSVLVGAGCVVGRATRRAAGYTVRDAYYGPRYTVYDMVHCAWYGMCGTVAVSERVCAA